MQSQDITRNNILVYQCRSQTLNNEEASKGVWGHASSKKNVGTTTHFLHFQDIYDYLTTTYMNGGKGMLYYVYVYIILYYYTISVIVTSMLNKD